MAWARFTPEKSWFLLLFGLRQLHAAQALHAHEKPGSLLSKMSCSPVRVFAAVGAGLALSTAGCGPSVQMIYEGNVHFEHCYRLDYDPSIAPSHRQACWKDWLARHTYGQTGDRLSYARRRLSELSQGAGSTLELSLNGAGPDSVSGPMPLPSSMHNAPPPKSLPAAEASAPARPATSAARLAEPAEAPCMSACRAHWAQCSDGCPEQSRVPVAVPGDAGISAAAENSKNACQSCTKAFRSCMRKCFR